MNHFNIKEVDSLPYFRVKGLAQILTLYARSSAHQDLDNNLASHGSTSVYLKGEDVTYKAPQAADFELIEVRNAAGESLPLDGLLIKVIVPLNVVRLYNDSPTAIKWCYMKCIPHPIDGLTASSLSLMAANEEEEDENDNENP